MLGSSILGSALLGSGIPVAASSSPVAPGGVPASSVASSVSVTASGSVTVTPSHVPSASNVGSVSVAPSGSVAIAPGGVPSTAGIGYVSISSAINGQVAPGGVLSRSFVAAITVTPTVSPLFLHGSGSTKAFGQATVAASGSVTVAPSHVPSGSRVGSVSVASVSGVIHEAASIAQSTSSLTGNATAIWSGASEAVSSSDTVAKCAWNGIVAGSFLARPVFRWPANWAQQPEVQIGYNLNPLFVGFGAPQFSRIQRHTAFGWNAVINLHNQDMIADFGSFLASVRGRWAGFWILAPFSEGEIVEGRDATSFYVSGNELSASWTDTASRYVAMTNGRVHRYGKIFSVVNDGNGRDIVTLESAEQPFDQSWELYGLKYVRFADDVEDWTFVAESNAVFRCRVAELPEEYESVETGKLPISLIEFDAGGVVTRATNFSEDVVSSGNTFVSRAIDFGSLRRSIGNGGDDVELLSARGSWNPLNKYFPLTTSTPVSVKIMTVQAQTPNVQTIEFTGQVDSVSMEGGLIKAKCSSFVSRLGRRVPSVMIQKRCNWIVYSRACGVDRTKFRAVASIVEIGGRVIKVAASGPQSPDRFDNAPTQWFALGFLETGSGDAKEIRTIEKSSRESGGWIYLTLSAPLVNAIVGDTATMYAGCDGLFRTCDQKFSNMRRFGGLNTVPNNLSIRAIETEQAKGGKK